MASTGIRETGARLMPRMANAPMLNFIELQNRHSRFSTKAGNTIELLRLMHESFQTRILACKFRFLAVSSTVPA